MQETATTMTHRPPGGDRHHRLPFMGVALALALIIATLGGTSFQRRVDSFQPLGFEYEAREGSWLITHVTIPETGLVVGDAVLREGDLRTRDGFEKLLRSQEETALLILRDGLVLPESYARQGLAVDYSYLILVGIAVIYLLIGLYTALKDSRRPGRLFYFWCLLSAAFYILSPVFPPQDMLDKVIALVEQFARTLLPALTLHLFLVFPEPLAHSKWRRRLLPALYLPAAFILSFHLDYGVGLLFPGASAESLEWVLRLDLWLLVLFSIVAALVALARLVSRPSWEKKRQVQWIVAGMLGGYVPFLLFGVIPVSLRLEWPEWTEVAAVLPLALVPLGFAYAILKYKLWDISLILRDSIANSLTVLVGICGFALIHMAIQRGHFGTRNGRGAQFPDLRRWVGGCGRPGTDPWRDLHGSRELAVPA